LRRTLLLTGKKPKVAFDWLDGEDAAVVGEGRELGSQKKRPAPAALLLCETLLHEINSAPVGVAVVVEEVVVPRPGRVDPSRDLSDLAFS
jgi:hypothetical protein